MIRIERKVQMAVLDPRVLAQLPEFARIALDALSAEPNLIIKGGLPRLCLIETLAAKNRWRDEERRNIERGIKDLDLVFLHYQTVSKDKDELLSRFDRLENYLADRGIYLKGEDVRPVKGGVDKATIRKILTTTADLTINECLLAVVDGKWTIFYTPQALRDIIEGTGFLCPQDGHIRYSSGRVLPSPLGWVRLIKFLCQGKVRKIYIQNWWVNDHLREAERMSNEAYDSSGLILGLYGLHLIEKYGKNNHIFQQRAARVLNALGFSPTRDPEEFVNLQRQNLANQGKEFALSELSFAESLENTIHKQRAREQKRHNRNLNKQQCEHQWQETQCDGCPAHCLLHTCLLCKASETNDLPCNKRVGYGNWPEDRDSLWSPQF